jgi:hypothetical protein
LRVELEYVLSVLHPGSTYEMPAAGGTLDIPGGPRCAARPNIYMSLGGLSADGADLRPRTEIQLRCEQTGAGGMGLVSALVTADGHKVTGRRPYVPGDMFLGGASILNAAGVAPYGSSTRMLQLRDLGVTPPADAGPLDNARISVTTVQKTAHLYRRVVIPQIRLEDWAVTSPGGGGL